ncbi:MAG: IS21-like element helper ATPase IstB [Dehalococcoidia bacterium]|jgi:DNA replication protein DnaC|nr:IS21-like element helper ATPase IstB [Dehalococcoidia bacterium]MDP7268757.1 IS21-like element helper ATPase IstB [Pirellulales bacterium]MDP7453358.1 IS21-like element helper ATPase IstB [Arenicellales bacterium]|tara:strand:- start:385 stop:1146 length:762 start_codon:yes stop_codon:yes gene_type:complete
MNNNQATLNKLTQMRLPGMVRAFRATMETGFKQSITPDELVSHLVDTEWDERYNRKLARLIKAARFRYPASFEEIDLESPRNLEKNLLLRLSEKGWIEAHQFVLVTGPTGTGKSFVVSALGHQACMHGFKTGYYSCSKLFKQLKLARADGSYLKALVRIQKLDLFILDDIGLEPFDPQSRMALLEILEDRIGRRSTIIVSQIPIAMWHQIIGDPTIADAICDRIFHSSHRIELKGESMRKKQSPHNEQGTNNE